MVIHSVINKKTDLQCALSKKPTLIYLQLNNKNKRKLIYNIFWYEKKKFVAVQELSHPLIFQRLFQQIFECSQ